MRLSLHMMVLNGASVVERALRPLKVLVDEGLRPEVVFTDTGSTDGTPEMISVIASELGMGCKPILVAPATHPDLYFLDAQSSFRTSFLGSQTLGGFTGGWIPRDWSRLRNLSLAACSGEYVLKLDADDEVMCPANLTSTLAYLDARPDIDIVMSTYEVMTRMPGSSPTVEQTTMYTRLWRRSAGLLFREVCHENVDHARNPDGSNWLMVPSGLVVRDWRDSIGMGVRPKHRNFKVLLLEYERLAELARLGADTRPSKHLLMYLADEAVPVVPRFALEVLDEVEYPTPADEIWRHIIRGQAMVRLGELRSAAGEYKSAASLGSPRAALLLGMLRCGLRSAGWKDMLSSAIPQCQQKMWPFGASSSELATARLLLGIAKDMEEV